ncbi:MAG: hypothetical protein R3A52_17660 [Polyangiales bacterium]
MEPSCTSAAPDLFDGLRRHRRRGSVVGGWLARARHRLDIGLGVVVVEGRLEARLKEALAGVVVDSLALGLEGRREVDDGDLGGLLGVGRGEGSPCATSSRSSSPPGVSVARLARGLGEDFGGAGVGRSAAVTSSGGDDRSGITSGSDERSAAGVGRPRRG